MSPSIYVLVPACPFKRHVWGWIDDNKKHHGKKCSRCGLTVKVSA